MVFVVISFAADNLFDSWNFWANTVVLNSASTTAMWLTTFLMLTKSVVKNAFPPFRALTRLQVNSLCNTRYRAGTSFAYIIARTSNKNGNEASSSIIIVNFARTPHVHKVSSVLRPWTSWKIVIPGPLKAIKILSKKQPLCVTKPTSQSE